MSAAHPLRVSGELTDHAQLLQRAGRDGGHLLQLEFKAARGVPYLARVDLGTDVADHMAVEQMLPALRPGATVTVAGTGLELRHLHGQPWLEVLGAHSAALLEGRRIVGTLFEQGALA